MMRFSCGFSFKEAFYFVGLLFVLLVIAPVHSLSNHLDKDPSSESWTCFQEIEYPMQPTFEQDTSSTSVINPQFEVYDTTDSCGATIDIPGVDKGDLNISVIFDDLGNKHKVQIWGKRRNVNKSDTIYHKLLEVDEELNIYDLVMSYSNGVVVLSIRKQVSTTQSVPNPRTGTTGSAFVPSPGSMLRGGSRRTPHGSINNHARHEQRRDDTDDESQSGRVWISNLRDLNSFLNSEAEDPHETNNVVSVQSEVKPLEEILQTELMGDHISDMTMEADDAEFEYWFNKM